MEDAIKKQRHQQAIDAMRASAQGEITFYSEGVKEKFHRSNRQSAQWTHLFDGDTVIFPKAYSPDDWAFGPINGEGEYPRYMVWVLRDGFPSFQIPLFAGTLKKSVFFKEGGYGFSKIVDKNGQVVPTNQPYEDELLALLAERAFTVKVNRHNECVCRKFGTKEVVIGPAEWYDFSEIDVPEF